MKSKIIFFYLLPLFLLSLSGCSDGSGYGDNHIIPDTHVEIDINLNYADFQDLKSSLHPVYIQSHNGKRVGYYGNGVIVMLSGIDEYFCYDATCTRCFANGDNSIVQREKGNPEGQCKQCNTGYFFNSYGITSNSGAEEGVEKIYPLKMYSITKRGNILSIRN